MKIEWLVTILLIVVFLFVEKKFPQVLIRFRLPINIALSALVLLLIAGIVIGIIQVVSSEMDASSKVFFTLFAIAYIAVCVWGVYRGWNDWLKERKKDE